ncbi:hypothetical protein [Snodgrassella communis]|uniref:hypothetical protein n=1 Tax=Snodgrassella communis TaxID=2946699 RepID=UPI001EF41906|nr:hypothetical protein [Snodgrassella communis]
MRLCAVNPACRYLAKEAIRWGAKSLITPPIFNDKADDDCRDENVEINDASSHNIIGGSPNPPDPDDKQNNKNSERKLPKTKKELREDLEKQGFTRKPDSAGGYEQWVRSSDQSKVWIKTNGEVIRIQRVWQKNGLKKYNERQNYWGERLADQSHSTGHFVK